MQKKMKFMHNQATVAVTYKGTHTSQTKVFLYTWERKPNKSMIPRSYKYQ